MGKIIKMLVKSLLKDYIQFQDNNNIKAHLFSGQIIIENAKLNPKIKEFENLPFRIAFSHIGKLNIKIPWLHLKKEPIEFILDELFIVLVDNQPAKVDLVQNAIEILNKIQIDCIKRLYSTKEENIEHTKSIRGKIKWIMNFLTNIQVINLFILVDF